MGGLYDAATLHALLSKIATGPKCVASPSKQFTQLLFIRAFGMFSLTAIPCRMHQISFDLRSYAAQGTVSTGVGGPPVKSSGCCELLLANISFNFAGANFLVLSVGGLLERVSQTRSAAPAGEY